MPRNGSGVMSWPPNTLGVPNTTVSSTRYNAFLADLLADLNAARPITAGGTGGTSAVSGNDNLNTTGADMASAATLNLANATGVVVNVTGTTPITALGTVSSGAIRTLVFAGALTLTHNATSLILPGGANIVTASGDAVTFRSKGAGNWVCVGYQKATGGPTVNVLSSPTITGTSIVTSTGDTNKLGLLQVLNPGGTSDARYTSIVTGKAAAIGEGMHFGFYYDTTAADCGGYIVNYGDGELTNSIFIRKGGNVGIGTSTPTEKLVVNGKINAVELQTNGVAIPFTLGFISADQAMTSGSQSITVAHSLGVVPKVYQVVIKCLTADQGYAVGDEIRLSYADDVGAASIQLAASSASLFYRTGAVPRIKEKSAGTVVTPTVARWAYVLKAFA